MGAQLGYLLIDDLGQSTQEGGTLLRSEWGTRKALRCLEADGLFCLKSFFNVREEG